MNQAANITATANQRPGIIGRVHVIDLLRGLVVILMALDHVRDYWSATTFWPEDLTQTTPEYFFTRWITHFCAPVFVFLSGTSAWLYRTNRQLDKGTLARFLLTRGLWLIAVEVIWMSFFWQLGYQFLILQVIWVIGCSMVVLAGLIYLPMLWIVGIGVVLVFGHNLLDGVSAERFGDASWVWMVLHEQGFYPLRTGPISGIAFGYPLIPWIGLMALGYAMGYWFVLPEGERQRRFISAGLSLLILFALLRGLNLYGNPYIWSADERGALWSLMAFLNTTKYPPSLDYLLMTIGPALLLIPLLENWRSRMAGMVAVFGKVPFFFYVLHVPVIHLSAWAWQNAAYGQRINLILPSANWPQEYEPSLLLTYLVWFLLIVLLYLPCRWFMEVRRRYHYWWLSYL